MTDYPHVDLALARRLERAEATANAASVDARRQLQPDVGAGWIEVNGAYAMFDGPDSPLTQTFGLGLFEPFDGAAFARVEGFFSARGAATAHEVCSFAPHDVLETLSTRRYVPIEASTVLVRSIADDQPHDDAIAVRAIGVDEAEMWSRLAARGWSSEAPELGPFLESIGAVIARARGFTCFVAERAGRPIATAGMSMSDGVALFAGAATVPEARRQGAQRALFLARLAYAAERGSELAMVVTQPGSASQRNAVRQGFRPVYTRAKWHRASTP